jgi:hypothetical protein
MGGIIAWCSEGRRFSSDESGKRALLSVTDNLKRGGLHLAGTAGGHIQTDQSNAHGTPCPILRFGETRVSCDARGRRDGISERHADSVLRSQNDHWTSFDHLARS